MLDSAAFYLFNRSQSCWKRGGMDGVREGLNRNEVEAVARALEIPWCEPILSKLEVCERVVLSHDKATRDADAMTRNDDDE